MRSQDDGGTAGWMLIWVALLVLLGLTSCLMPHRRQQKLDREWRSIWENWQIESRDDCDYINSFKKSDCLKRHNLPL
jgi:hypothetical protein